MPAHSLEYLTISVVIVIATAGTGCAAIVGADFDVSARPDPSPSDPNGVTSGIEGPVNAFAPWRVSAKPGEAQLLGVSVAVEGDTALVGARNKDWFGQVFVVRGSYASGWDIESEALTAGEYGAPYAQFGSSVALSGDWAIVGASAQAKEDSGAAYFFHRAGGKWTIAQPELKASPSGVNGDHFGTRVAIENDVAVVGAPGAEGDGAVGGAVHVFRLGADGIWVETQRLTPPDGMPGDSFGFELALRSTTLVVGSPFNDEAGTEAGAAYVFERSGLDWNPVPKKLGPVSADGDATGSRMGLGTIGLEDGLLLVPAAKRIEAFKRDSAGNWVPDTFTPPRGLVARESSWRATIHGDRAVLAVGTADNLGMGILYERAGSDWKLVKRLEARSSSREDFFGWTIAYDGTTACFGAIFSQDRDGAVYFFDPLQ